MTSPFEPPQATTDSQPVTQSTRLVAMAGCLLSWPAAVSLGWILGDEHRVILMESTWRGYYPLTSSPGFGCVVLTIVPYLLGVAFFLNTPQKKLAYVFAMAGALIGGLFSFLLAVARNLV